MGLKLTFFYIFAITVNGLVIMFVKIHSQQLQFKIRGEVTLR